MHPSPTSALITFVPATMPQDGFTSVSPLLTPVAAPGKAAPMAAVRCGGPQVGHRRALEDLERGAFGKVVITTI